MLTERTLPIRHGRAVFHKKRYYIYNLQLMFCSVLSALRCPYSGSAGALLVPSLRGLIGVGIGSLAVVSPCGLRGLWHQLQSRYCNSTHISLLSLPWWIYINMVKQILCYYLFEFLDAKLVKIFGIDEGICINNVNETWKIVNAPRYGLLW